MVDIQQDKTKVIKSFNVSQINAEFLRKLVDDGINVSSLIDHFLLKARNDWIKMESEAEIKIVHLE